MAANASDAKLLSGGGSLKSDDNKDKICEAFRAAVKRACAKNKGGSFKDPKKFNDLFYEELGKVAEEGDGLDKIAREVPALMERGALGGTGDVAAAAFGENGVSEAAEEVWAEVGGASSGITGSLGAGVADSVAWGVLRGVGRLAKAAGFKFRFMDGVMEDGSVLELKGPGDKFHKGQAKDLKKLNGNKQPKVASCYSCDAPCANEGGGRKAGCL